MILIEKVKRHKQRGKNATLQVLAFVNFLAEYDYSRISQGSPPVYFRARTSIHHCIKHLSRQLPFAPFFLRFRYMDERRLTVDFSQIFPLLLKIKTEHGQDHTRFNGAIVSAFCFWIYFMAYSGYNH